MYKSSYATRASKHANPAARLLLETIARKQSNLAVSVDVTKAADFLAIIDAVGPYVCLIKASILLTLTAAISHSVLQDAR